MISVKLFYFSTKYQYSVLLFKCSKGFFHLALEAGAMDLKVSKMGAAFSFKFLLMSKITERETRMIIKPSANLEWPAAIVKNVSISYLVLTNLTAGVMSSE